MQLNIFSQKDAVSKSNKDESIDPNILAIDKLDTDKTNSFQKKIIIDSNLNRKIVSFQGNKNEAQYRWFKYKESFSFDLVKYLIYSQNDIDIKSVLDPFAGIGTTLFACSQLGIDSDGIELLPIGKEVIEVRQLLNNFSQNDFLRLTFWKDNLPWKQVTKKKEINQLTITKGAYPPTNKDSIERFLYLLDFENDKLKKVLLFALICVLESVSYTRKDGQYLRWDKRANRKNGSKRTIKGAGTLRPTSSKFCKGKILEFDIAIVEQIEQILFDACPTYQNNLFEDEPQTASINLRSGSCLQIMPSLKNDAYDAIITSPPYCNRYDYTRTYALELALLGITQEELTQLRQDMLSCTVENKAKPIIENWKSAIEAANQEKLLQLILDFLESESEIGKLNNKGIPRMVKGYFYEMSCVIAESFRVLRPGGYMFMVNDNVRYAGINISVDLILSSIAEKLGFTVEKILVSPTKKGNSSQQMGIHGRKPLRKCVYVWRKPS